MKRKDNSLFTTEGKIVMVFFIVSLLLAIFIVDKSRAEDLEVTGETTTSGSTTIGITEDDDWLCVPDSTITEDKSTVTGETEYTLTVRPVAWKAGKITGLEVKYQGRRVTVGETFDSCGDKVAGEKAVVKYSVTYVGITPVSVMTQASMDTLGSDTVTAQGMKAEVDTAIAAELE